MNRGVSAYGGRPTETKLVGTTAIRICQPVHRYPTSLLAMAIAVELQNIAIGIIAESLSIVVCHTRIGLRPVTPETARCNSKYMLARIQQAVQLVILIGVAGGALERV